MRKVKMIPPRQTPDKKESWHFNLQEQYRKLETSSNVIHYLDMPSIFHIITIFKATKLIRWSQAFPSIYQIFGKPKHTEHNHLKS